MFVLKDIIELERLYFDISIVRQKLTTSKLNASLFRFIIRYFLIFKSTHEIAPIAIGAKFTNYFILNVFMLSLRSGAKNTKPEYSVSLVLSRFANGCCDALSLPK